MQAPLYQALCKYAGNKAISFHMPGHKNRLNGAITAWDVTELPGLDNLHGPAGVIAEAQQLAAKTFGAEESFFLVNGSTSGVLAAVAAVCSQGESIILQRNAHISAFNALILSGAIPRYVLPEVLPGGLAGCVSPQEIQKALDVYPEAKAVLITSPTYDGFVADVAGIKRVCNEKNAVLIVDEAHGAHFAFHAYFPDSALSCGADIVVQSMHKTLSVPTGCAVCHVQGPKVNRERMQKTISLVTTTSPSYMLMGAMDECRARLDSEGKILFGKYADRLQWFRKEAAAWENIALMDENIKGQGNIFDYDRAKLLFQYAEEGFCPDAFTREGIYVEISRPGYFLAMTSYENRDADFEALLRVMQKIDQNCRGLKREKSHGAYPLAPMALSPKEAFSSDTHTVELERAGGHISGETITPYPPGIPLIVAGEIITAEILDYLQALKATGTFLATDSGLETVKIIRK